MVFPCVVLRKMALSNLLHFSLKHTLSLDAFRFSKRIACMQRLNWYSTSEKEAPVKFTTTKAYKATIAENLNINPVAADRPWYQQYVVLASVAAFLIYFCILREENDLDEKLKGNPEYTSDYNKYIQLQLHLSYCKQNKIPHAALQEKVDELRERLQKQQGQ